MRWLAIAALLLSNLSAQAEGCRKQQDFTVCDFDAAQDRIALFNSDETGSPYQTFSNLKTALESQGKELAFAMNAGMFGVDFKAIGLYVEGGKRLHKLNRANGAGNFHLKPNGVFYIVGETAGVMETEAFAKSGIKPDYATQSGPMLVINGKIHPKISPNGTSAKTRNGVCVTDDTQVHFVISDSTVTFYDFASLFLNELHCGNALFFDGSVSAIFSKQLNRNDQLVPLGPMVGVTEAAK